VVKINQKRLVAGALESWEGGGSGHAVGLYRPLDSAAEGLGDFCMATFAWLLSLERKRKLEGLVFEWHAENKLGRILAALKPDGTSDLFARSDAG
jgi:hypothetical protein